MKKMVVNNITVHLDVEPDEPLLWILREKLGLTGAKYACGKGLCGACTVLLDGRPVRSCIVSAADIGEGRITTIEGLSDNLRQNIERIWSEEGASECGYCQPGQVMSVIALLMENPRPTDSDIDAAMAGNICRCGIYQRIRKAIHRLAVSGLPGKIHHE